jgi:hypothetical protein
MKTGDRIESRLGLQVLVVLLVWILLCLFHWHNDGLWFFDATQHAAHGVFWKDFVTHLTLDPLDYVMSYFARYPIIRPTRYPPAFYLLMASSYSLFGTSPYVAKCVVFSFALMAALYTVAWCRRWVCREAGWIGALILLLPIVITWTHAVMLNVPILALSIAGLYHYRRWLSSPADSIAWKHLYIGVFFAVFSILTHVVNCVIVLLYIILLLIERRGSLLLKLKTMLTMLASALVLLPWFIITMKYERGRVEAVVGSTTWLTEPSRWHWMYYIKNAPSLFGVQVLCFAALGLVMGLYTRRWRRETSRLFIIMLTCYLFFTYMRWNDVRYIILVSLPLSILSGIALMGILQGGGRLLKHKAGFYRPTAIATVLILLIGQIWMASRVQVPCVSGYDALVDYLEEVAPHEPIFYDGYRHDIFTYYVLAGDPNYQRRAVLGDRLLYAKNSSGGEDQGYATSPESVVDLLAQKGGACWIAVDETPMITEVKAPDYLRQAVQGPHFEYVKSFPIKRRHRKIGNDVMQVNLYRLLEPITPIVEVEIPYVSQGKIVHFRTKPIAH